MWLVIFLLIVSPSLLFGAIQVFAIVVFVVIALIVVGLLVLRWKVSKIQRDAQQAAGSYSSYTEQQGGAASASEQQQSQNRSRDPKVKIYVKPNEKRVSSDVGDYVDFEEVNDEK